MYRFLKDTLAFVAVLAVLILISASGSRAQVYNPPDTYSREEVNALAAQQLSVMQATIPQVVKSTNVTADTNGAFSVTWTTPFVSATPTTTAETVMPNALPAQCQITSSTATGVSGFCAQAGATSLGANLAAIVGVTINPDPARGPAGTRVMVIAREPTQ